MSERPPEAQPTDDPRPETADGGETPADGGESPAGGQEPEAGGRPGLGELVGELRRRRIFRVAGVYAVVGWLLLQVGDIVVEPLHLPPWTMSLLIVLLALGFPVAMLLAWAFDITPEGVRRTPPLRAVAGGVVPGIGRPSAVYAGLGVLIVVLGVGAYALLTQALSFRGAAGGDPEAPRFMAVLPFSNESPDPDNEFFANGVTDDILAQLSIVPQFALISRTTMMGYRGTTKGVREIADELGVQYVLEGTVRKVDDQVRINARLVEGATDRPLWGDTFDRRLEDIFAVQSEIARQIARALEVELAGGVAERMERRPTADVAAYEDFLLARESFHRYDLAGTERAIELLRRALDRDPGFELARAWLGRSYVVYAVNHGMGTAWADSAVAVSRRAAEAQPDLADAHGALGAALAISGRIAEAIPVLERTLELNPNDWAAIGNLAVSHTIRGDWDEGIRFTRMGFDLEGARLTSPLHTNLAMFSLELGLDARAEVAVQPALDLMPDAANPIAVRAWIDFHRGDLAAARRGAERLSSQTTRSPSTDLVVAELLLWTGAADAALPAAESVYSRSPTAYANTYPAKVLFAFTLLEAGAVDRAGTVLAEAEAHARGLIDAGSEAPHWRYALAGVFAMRGDPDEALRWLEEAVDLGWNRAWLTGPDPILRPLRDTPRFAAAIARMEASVARMRERVERSEW